MNLVSLMLAGVALCHVILASPTGTPPSDSSFDEKTSRLQCGQSFRSDSKIVNGTEAVAHQFPFMVAFHYYKSFQFCGASIYDKYTVITAAHCLTEKSFKNHWLYFGEHDKNADEPGVQMRKAVSYINHPEYKGGVFKNDIAIMKLGEPIEWSETVQPICMPTSYAEGDEPAIIMGWGGTKGTANNKVLQTAAVPIISDDVCGSQGWYGTAFKKGYHVCAGYAEGQIDSCQGDSGGPMVQYVDGQFELAGIVSWGKDCAKPQKPGVYTRVSEYVDWIRETAGEPQY